MRVQDVMTIEVVTARPSTSLKDVAAELSRRRISGMPVVDDTGRIVGVVSEADILAKEQPEREHHSSRFAGLLHRDDDDGQRATRFDATVVSEAMSSPATTIEGHMPAAIAAQQMTERGINRLPVVQQGRLVGIVTRADLVRAFARSDEEIAGEVREIVALQQELWRDEQPLEVTIAAGEVTLAGSLRAREEAPLLTEMVRTVPGVVSVRASLTWSEEDKPIPAHATVGSRPWRT